MPTPDTDADAQAWMDYANRRVSETWNALPPELTTTLPPVSNAAQHTAGPYGGSSAGGSGADHGSTSDRHGVHGLDGQSGSGGRFGPGDQLSPHDRHGRPSDAGGVDLAGFDGSHGTGLGVGLGGPAGSAPSDIGSSGLPGLGGTGTGGAPTTGGLPAAGGTTTGTPGNKGSGAGAAPFGAENPTAARQAAGIRPTGGSGAGGPMLSAGSGQGPGERELTRNKWSPEDRETWTGKSQSAPSVVGEPGGKDAGKTSRPSKRDEAEDRETAKEHDGDENELTDEPANEVVEEVTEEPDAEDPFSELEAKVSLEDLGLAKTVIACAQVIDNLASNLAFLESKIEAELIRGVENGYFSLVA
ncbi:MAG: hypothetical protein ACRDP6_31875, partial [Actinoallomurus sp.]